MHREPIPPFSKETRKYLNCKILIDNLTGNQLLEALTLLWCLGINGFMENADEEDWEGIILVQGIPMRNNNKGYICCCHTGFTTWNQLKDEEERQLPIENGGSCFLQTTEALASYRQWRLKILCSPRSRNFWHGSLRYTNLFFIPIFFPLFDVCDVCFFCYFHFPHQIIYFFCHILIPDCHPRVCVNVYRF